MSERPNIEDLFSAYLDGELTQQMRQRVENHLDRDAEARRALDELGRVRAGIGSMESAEPTAEQWSRMMQAGAMKTSRWLGWGVGLFGATLIVGFAIYEFATDRAVSALEKIAVAGLIGGVALLLMSVLLERVRARKSDRYKDVKL